MLQNHSTNLSEFFVQKARTSERVRIGWIINIVVKDAKDIIQGATQISTKFTWWFSWKDYTYTALRILFTLSFLVFSDAALLNFSTLFLKHNVLQSIIISFQLILYNKQSKQTLLVFTIGKKIQIYFEKIQNYSKKFQFNPI